MTPSKTLIVAVMLVVPPWVLDNLVNPDRQTSYPLAYRRWTHVRSALVDPKSPTAGRYGGLHHIYANEIAMAGYSTGQFPDGSVIVFDLLETRDSAGTTVEGPRKFIDVMIKDSKRYAETGGWEFEEFMGDNHKDPVLTAEAKSQCYKCHTRQRSHDFVFSTFRE
jgi:hypothetical protein